MKKPSDLIRPQGHFLRSVQLERDFDDPLVLDGYILSPVTIDFLKRIENSLRPESGDRSFRILGHYGSGKSTFALFLAHWMKRDFEKLPKLLVDRLHAEDVGVSEAPPLIPLLVTCRREPMAKAIQRAIRNVMDEASLSASTCLTDLLSLEKVEDAHALDLLNAYRDNISKKGEETGILLIVDEAGKLLEYAAQNSDETDVYLWQLLSETVANSRKSANPFLMVSIFHQGFAAYASELGMSSLNEWNKISGRFTELNLLPGLEQTLLILSAALNVNTGMIGEKERRVLSDQMGSAIELGWFSPEAGGEKTKSLAEKLFPICAFAIPPLERLMRKYGQNERSLFSFLFGGEPGSPLALLETKNSLFGLADLYDYFLNNYDQVISASSEASRWVMVKNMLSAVCGEDSLTDKIVKSIGILNLLNMDDLIPTSGVVAAALAPEYSNNIVLERIEHLSSEKGKGVIYDRKGSGGLSLWSHTSVDIGKALKQASSEVGKVADCVSHVVDYLGSENIVARRHYMQTGNLRYFSVNYCSFEEFRQMAAKGIDLAPADGALVIPLCSTHKETKAALSCARTIRQPNVVTAVPNRPLETVAGIIQELLVWEHLILNTPELNGDPFAQETVALQRDNVRSRLKQAVHAIAGVGQRAQVGDLEVFWKGSAKTAQFGRTKRQATAFLSRVFDDVFEKSPRVHHELLNRNKLSSSGAGAQMRLIENILESSSLPFLGMDVSKRPPEMSMYLSVLKKGNIHVERPDKRWELALPDVETESHLLNIRPALDKCLELLGEVEDAKVPVSTIISELSQPEYGVRLGLAYVLLAIFKVLHEKDVAFYEDGRFLSEVTGAEFQRLMKKPETFAMQLCKIEGLRADVYSRLSEMLQLELNPEEADLLEIVRPLCVFTAQLPPYVTKTNLLSPQTLAVRDALLKAREPIKVVFEELPIACGLAAFSEKTFPPPDADIFLKRLRSAIIELRECFPRLENRLIEHIRQTFEYKDGNWRQTLLSRAEKLGKIVSEPRIKSFCFRLSDSSPSESKWAISIAALLTSKPPQEWADREENIFKFELGQYVNRFKRVEATTFDSGTVGDSEAVRLCFTQADGTEINRVLSKAGISEDAKREIRSNLSDMVKKYGENSLSILFEILDKKTT